jgi:ribosome-associated protein
LQIIEDILRDKKAEDVEIINVVGRTLMADYFVIASGTSNIHIKAIADALIIDAKRKGVRKHHVEGYAEARWVLVDYGDIIVHIMLPVEREYYDIESLWRETAARLESAAR